MARTPMGFDMDIAVYRPKGDHYGDTKVCFKYECEPDKDDLLADVCGRFNDGVVPWDRDDVYAIMETHVHSNLENLCERCRFFTRLVRPLDSKHIQHAYRNPVLGSKWFLDKLYCVTCGPTSDLFHAQSERLSEMTSSSVERAIESLMAAAPQRTSDKEAVAESLAVLHWVRAWFKTDPTVAVLVNSDW